VPRIGQYKISVPAFVAIVTLLDVFGLILILLAIQYAGSGLFEGEKHRLGLLGPVHFELSFLIFQWHTPPLLHGLRYYRG
jgi:hypothetical protein